MNTSNNILYKIANSSWGAGVLQTTIMLLTYSVVGYCDLVWVNSSHTHVIDTRLNNVMNYNKINQEYPRPA